MPFVRHFATIACSLALVALGAVIIPVAPAQAATGTVPAGLVINSYGPNWDVTVDCNVFTFGTENVEVPGRLGDQMTVHTTNCAGFIYDLATDYGYSHNHPAGFAPQAQSAAWGSNPITPDIWRATPIPTVFTLTPGALFYFNDPDYNHYKGLGFTAAPAVDDPSGVLTYLDTGTFTPDSPRFTAVGGGFFHYLNGDTNCRMVEGQHPYATMDVEITQAGEYTFRYVDASPDPSWLYSWMKYHPVQDTLLAVYTSFDPADPESNVVSCNDDGRLLPDQALYTTQSGQVISVSCPSFTASLDPAVSTHYTLVMTTYNAYDTSLWNSYNYGTGTGTFEMWGPEDGFVIPEGALLPGSNNGSNEAAAPSGESSGAALPDTGLNLLRLVLTCAGLFGAAGFVYLLRAGLIQAGARTLRRSTFEPIAERTRTIIQRGRR